MSTVIPSDTTSEESSSNYPAPKNILRCTYESVLAALQEDKRVILITGDEKKGKTALIHTISKDIAETQRIINLSRKYLPYTEKLKDKNSSPELYNMKDFFLKSTDLGDKLVVSLDDAHCLPINFLSELIEHAKCSSAKDHSLQLILSGPLTFKDQLMSIEQIGSEDLVHFPMDTLSEQTIRAYVLAKTYKISSIIKRLEFESESFRTLADFIQSSQQVLDVILEWCAALAKKDQLTSISSHTVNRAISFAQQYAIDKNLGLDNAYPPSHEVYQYINNAKSTQGTTQESTTKTSVESDEKPNKTKPYNQETIQQTNYSVIASEERDAGESVQIQPVGNEVLQRQHAAENESMPLQWTPPAKRGTAKIKSFPVMAGLITILLLGFITFIAFRIGPNTSIEESQNEHVNLNQSEDTVIEEQLAPDTVVATTENSLNSDTQPQKPTIDAEKNVNENAHAAEINTNNVATIQLEEQITSLNKIPGNELSHNDQDKVLAPQENIHIVDNSLPSKELNELLALAKQQLENKNLSTPAGDNALDTYQYILTNDPNNLAAIDGVKKVHDKYLSWANYYFQNNEVSRAAHFYNKALSIDPNDTVAKNKLQTIVAQQETIATTEFANESNTDVLQNSKQTALIQNLLVTAEQSMQQIETDIGANNRNYNSYQKAQTAYQNVLRSEPQNQQAKQGLSLLKDHYTDWAELHAQSKNYNIALFLYGQALAIEPKSSQIAQRIEQLLEFKKAL